MGIGHNLKVFFGFEEDQGHGSHEQYSSPDSGTEFRVPVRNTPKSAINTIQPKVKASAMHEIKVYEPKIYEDSLYIAGTLRDNRPVIVNLKNLDREAGKRLVDFVCGTTYAINGHMMKIGDNIFLFTPETILISDHDEKTTFEQGLDEERKETFFKRISPETF